VLADIPCSGSGTTGHRPDVLLKTDPVQPALLALQAELLAHAATLVRPGGRLVLSTCSLDPRENGEQAAKLLECRPFLRPRPDLAPATCRDEAGGWRWLPWTRPAGRPGGRPGAGGAWALALDREV
jgi:16S rRNA (cytosine967-C5)-methyltransferase